MSCTIATSLSSIQYTLKQGALKLKFEVLGAEHPDTIEVMYRISKRWYEGSMYGEACALEGTIVEENGNTQGGP